MKNLKNGNSFCPLPPYKYIVVFSMVLLVAFTLVSCGGLVDDVPDGYGNVRVSFGSSRNVTQNDKDAATITVYFNGNQIEKKGDVFESLVESGIRLTITAEAVNGGRIVGKGEESIIVRDGPNDVQMKIYTYDNFVVTVGGKATGWTNFTDAWNDANGKTATIKMNADGSIPDVAGLTLTGGNVTLDLNGHSIDVTAPNPSAFILDAGTFTLNDSVGSGAIFSTAQKSVQSGQGGGGVHVKANAVFIMNGGTMRDMKQYQGNASSHYGCILVSSYGAFTMNGGVIENITLSGGTSGNGGGVYVSGGATFTMNGGTIRNNLVGAGQAAGTDVYISSVFTSSDIPPATFTMTGGNILSNYDKALCVAATAAGTETPKSNIVNISGGTINKGFISSGVTYNGQVLTSNLEL